MTGKKEEKEKIVAVWQLIVVDDSNSQRSERDDSVWITSKIR